MTIPSVPCAIYNIFPRSRFIESLSESQASISNVRSYLRVWKKLRQQPIQQILASDKNPFRVQPNFAGELRRISEETRERISKRESVLECETFEETAEWIELKRGIEISK